MSLKLFDAVCKNPKSPLGVSGADTVRSFCQNLQNPFPAEVLAVFDPGWDRGLEESIHNQRGNAVPGKRDHSSPVEKKSGGKVGRFGSSGIPGILKELGQPGGVLCPVVLTDTPEGRTFQSQPGIQKADEKPPIRHVAPIPEHGKQGIQIAGAGIVGHIAPLPGGYVQKASAGQLPDSFVNHGLADVHRVRQLPLRRQLIPGSQFAGENRLFHLCQKSSLIEGASIFLKAKAVPHFLQEA